MPHPKRGLISTENKLIDFLQTFIPKPQVDIFRQKSKKSFKG